MYGFREFVAERIGCFDQVRGSLDEIRALIGRDRELLSHLDAVEHGVGIKIITEIQVKLNEMEMSETN